MSKTPTGLWSLPLAPESTKHFASDPIPLNTGAPPFPVHPSVRSAIIKSVEEAKDKLSYPPTRGIQDLQKKVAHDYGYPEEGVLITYGASQALYNILDTIPCDEEVLIPAPFWFAFPNIVAQGRGKLKIIQTSAEDNFKLTPQRLAQSITWKSRMLILTNPNNPTGAIYTREELDALVKVLLKHPRLLVVSDEVYNLLLIDGQDCPSISSWPEMTDRVLVVNSLSKNYAMSGLRVGFVAAHPSWIDICLQKQNYATSGVNEFLQRGALAAFEASSEIISSTVEEAGAVRLMTVHKSKGLEFPIVWLADTTYKGRSSQSIVASHADYGIAIRIGEDHLETDDEKLRAASYAMLQKVEQQMERAEKKRLLYVAATRARDHLIISGAPGAANPNGDHWLGRILSALEVDGESRPLTCDYPGGHVALRWHDADAESA